MTIRTTRKVFRPDDTSSTDDVEPPDDFGLSDLRSVVLPCLEPGAEMEHVAVLHNGARRDLFVDDNGHARGLPRNDRATEIYRNNWLTQHPGTDPETLPVVVGTAVLFPDMIVWR